jgi:hypothetical protein
MIAAPTYVVGCRLVADAISPSKGGADRERAVGEHSEAAHNATEEFIGRRNLAVADDAMFQISPAKPNAAKWNTYWPRMFTLKYSNSATS